MIFFSVNILWYWTLDSLSMYKTLYIFSLTNFVIGTLLSLLDEAVVNEKTTGFFLYRK